MMMESQQLNTPAVARVATALELAAKSLCDAVQQQLLKQEDDTTSTRRDVNDDARCDKNQNDHQKTATNKEEVDDEDDDMAAAFFRRQALQQVRASQLPSSEWATLYVHAMRKEPTLKELQLHQQKQQLEKQKWRDQMMNEILPKLK